MQTNRPHTCLATTVLSVSFPHAFMPLQVQRMLGMAVLTLTQQQQRQQRRGRQSLSDKAIQMPPLCL
jgi:hypothetical protein